jgi:hypothetical protein
MLLGAVVLVTGRRGEIDIRACVAIYGSACWSRARQALIAALIVAVGFVAVATGLFAFTAPAVAAEVCGAETFLTVEFTNTSDSPLTLKEIPDLEGEFCNAPPHTIGVNEKVVISSYNTDPFFGTEFTLIYELANHSQLEVNYEVPEIGSNSSRATAPPEYVVHTAEPENFLFTTTFEGCKLTGGDGICDQWKEHGVTIDPTTGRSVPPGTPGGQFIDLPHMGVSLDRPTVMVQMDWMENEKHNQKLRQSAIDKVIEAYNSDPVTYPGATRSGVTLVVDAGPDSTITPGGEKWGSLSRAKAIPWKENFTTGKRNEINFTPYEELFKNNFVPTGRKPIFHYDTIVAGLSSESEGTSGWTPSGDGSIISLGDWTGGVGSEGEQAGTFMHEFGHVLGLSHGGEDTINFKPNYPSVMNYFYQTSGVPRNGENVYDYSREPEPSVNETTLTEKGGISLGANLQKYAVTWKCPTAGTKTTAQLGEMDLNCDGTTPDGGTGFDVGGEKGEGETVLAGAVRSDWERLDFTTGGVGTGRAVGSETVLPSAVDAVDEITPAIAAQVRRTPVVAYTGATTGDYHEPVTVSATLTDPTFTPASAVAGASIAFKLGPSPTDTCTATTNASGVASCTITPTQQPGPYSVVAGFAGNSSYQPVSDTHAFTILRAATALSYGGTAHVANGASATLTGTLLENGTTPTSPSGQAVSFTLGSGATAQSCSGTVASNGNVQCTITKVQQPDSPTFSVPVSGKFAGDSYYLPSTSPPASVELVYFTGRAYGTSFSLFGQPPLLVADTGEVKTAQVSTVTRSAISWFFSGGTGAAPTANVSTAAGGVTASASASSFSMSGLFVPTIQASKLTATSHSTCSGSSGSLTASSLTINGKTVTVAGAPPNTVIHLPLGGTVTLDQQISGAGPGLTVNALHVSVPGVIDYVQSSATTAAHNCP